MCKLAIDMTHDALKLLAGDKPKKKRKSKYNNKQITAFGITFDSKGEYHRYIYLKDLQSDGVITEFKHQVAFDISANGFHICNYIADFTYKYKDELVVEDYKKIQTDVFKLKSKMMLAINGIIVRITGVATCHPSNLVKE